LPAGSFRVPLSDQIGNWRGRRLWLTVATVLGAGLAILPWVSSFGPLSGERSGILAAFIVTAVPGTLLLVASRRPGLSRRLRQALGLLAFSMLLTAGGNLLRLVNALGITMPNVPGLDLITTVAIWALGIAALVLIPLTPLGRGAWWRIATDITIAGAGMGLAIFVIWTLPGLSLAPPAMRSRIMMYNWMEAANLTVLSLILVRGPLRPIRRAVWWLAATIIIETTYLIALQYAIGRQAHDFRLTNSLFFVDYLAYLYAAVLFLTDPQPEADAPFLPEPMQAVNPLPMLAVFGVGGLLVVAALGNPDRALLPLAVGIVLMALLLLARVIGATWANLRLIREEAAEHARRHTENLELMGRVAGGIAHVLNNLMNVVRLHAELVLLRVGPNQPVRDNVQAIDVAAQRASALAARLMLASGRRRGDHQRGRLADVVRLLQEPVTRQLGTDREMAWEMPDAGGEASVDPSELEAILRELVANARDATPNGGRITIRVLDERVSQPPAGISPTVPSGRYSVLEVADTGRGIAPADLPRVLDPFFSTRPIHEGRGLGLSVVHGIVASCGGGLLIDTVPGTGTRVSVYLPITSRKTA
jgi:signal transduction histidine kinase